MERRSFDKMIAFRTSAAQVRLIEKIAVETGQSQSDVIRQMVDSALLVGRPVIVSNYAQPPVGDQRMAVSNGA